MIPLSSKATSGVIILHPEEILADNFALLMLEVQDVRSTEILFQMKEILS